MNPEGLVSRVLKSPWASIQTIPGVPLWNVLRLARVPRMNAHSPPRQKVSLDLSSLRESLSLTLWVPWMNSSQF